MRLAAHIIGTNSARIATMCDQLLTHGIHATHPLDDEFFNAESWSPYEIDLSNYEAITASTVLIVCNEHPITAAMAQQMCYAISKNKPIVLTDALSFDSGVDHTLADIILGQATLFHAPQSLEHIDNFLQILPRRQSYALLPYERLRIAIICRTYFRELLQRSNKSFAAMTQKVHAAM